MFRRLADRVFSAVASVTGSTGSGSGSDESGPSDPVGRLASMGFSSADARQALQISGNNVEEAAEWLLTNGASRDRSMGTTAATAQTEEDELEKAISASLEEAAKTSTAQTRPAQSAAAHRAGQAALARLGKGKTPKTTAAPTVAQSHPNVKVPKCLSQHDKEDVILRCAQRVAPSATAVDTLLKSLKQLQQNTTNPKFRTIDTTTAGFNRSLNVPGAVDFFKAMGYHASFGNMTVLELSFVDPATLYLGISALEQVQQNSKEYQQNKTQIVFDREIQRILALADQDMEEALKRSKFMSKLPSEPATGGGQMTIELGSSSKIQRKFDGDDCLYDVLNWLGANGSAIPEKLDNNEWYLVNRNYADPIAYNVEDLKGKTLQYIGCWPSGRLAIVPIPPATYERTSGSSRGLGAAPMDALKIT